MQKGPGAGAGHGDKVRDQHLTHHSRLESLHQSPAQAKALKNKWLSAHLKYYFLD